MTHKDKHNDDDTQLWMMTQHIQLGGGYTVTNTITNKIKSTTRIN